MLPTYVPVPRLIIYMIENVLGTYVARPSKKNILIIQM